MSDLSKFLKNNFGINEINLNKEALESLFGTNKGDAYYQALKAIFGDDLSTLSEEVAKKLLDSIGEEALYAYIVNQGDVWTSIKALAAEKLGADSILYKDLSSVIDSIEKAVS